MITTCDYESSLGHLGCKEVERLDHEFEALVSSPLAKGQDAMRRRAPTREVRKLWPPGQQSVSSQVDIVATIFVVQNFAISGHQHRD